MNIDGLAKRSDLHIVRKLSHVACGSAAIGMYYTMDLPLKFWGAVAFAIGIVGFILDFSRLKNNSFNELAVKLLGPILRKSELQSFSGLPFYAMGIGLSVYFYSKDIAIISIMFLVFADPISSFVGVNYGKDQILPNKTLQGTFGGFLVCYLIISIYTYDNSAPGISLFLFAFFGAMVGAVSELFSAFNIDDNITIPVIGGAGLTLLNFFFQIF